MHKTWLETKAQWVAPDRQLRDYLKDYRRNVIGISQEKLGEILGVGKSTIVRWENGHVTPKGLPHIHYAYIGIAVVYSEETHK